MSRPDVEGIEARASKATAGPWRKLHGRFDPQVMRGDVPIADFRFGLDATFVADARADIPVLCAYIHKLEAALKALRQPRGCDAGDGSGISIAERFGS